MMPQSRPANDASEKIRITVAVSRELHLAAKIKAARTGTPMAVVMRNALRGWVLGLHDRPDTEQSSIGDQNP